MIKKHKKLIIAVVILWIIFCLVYGGILWREMLIFNRGSELMSCGDYTAAKAEFEKIGETGKMAECDYLYTLSRLDRAKALMDEGLLEEAKAELVILGDFENAPELVTECDYRRALKLYEEGLFSDAIKLAQRLDEHPGSNDVVEQCRARIYEQAVQLAYECRLDEAMALFAQIQGYKDADNFYLRCSRRIVKLLSDWEEPVNYSEYAGRDVGSGILYWHRIGLIYVPHSPNADTSAMIFFPGGYDQSLANGYMSDYLYGHYGSLPNALMVFCYANGYGSFDEKMQDAYNVLDQAAMEHNIFLHDISLIGASNGAYTAAHGAAWLWETEGLAAKNVLTLDAGQHWESFMPVLSTDECDSLAKAGTKFYLLEGDGVGMNKLAIQTMVAHKIDTQIIHVRDYGHYSVIYDAMKYGIFSWIMGDGDRPENDNYTYIKLDKNSTYPG